MSTSMSTTNRRRFKVGDEVYLRTLKESDLKTAKQRRQHVRRVIAIVKGSKPGTVVLDTEANHSRVWKHSDLTPASH